MTTPELLGTKELATALKRSSRYVYQMRARGFSMVAGRTTLVAALRWLETNPCPFRRTKALTKSAK